MCIGICILSYTCTKVIILLFSCTIGLYYCMIYYAAMPVKVGKFYTQGEAKPILLFSTYFSIQQLFFLTYFSQYFAQNLAIF